MAHSITCERSWSRRKIRVSDLFTFKHILEDGLRVLIVANLVLRRESNDFVYRSLKVISLLATQYILARVVMI